jgi:hypothetical protein
MNAKKPHTTAGHKRTGSRARARAAAAAGRLQARTRAAQARFAREYAKHANISKACRVAGVGRATVYEWLRDDKAFAALHAAAREEAIDGLELEARRRAVEGTLKPVFQNGRKVGAVREYSDTLLIVLLKAARPTVYREQVTHKIGGRLGLGSIQSKTLSNEDLRRLTLAAAAGGVMAAAITARGAN